MTGSWRGRDRSEMRAAALDEYKRKPQVVDMPPEIHEGDRLTVRWGDGREETVTVDKAHRIDGGYRLEVTLP